MANSPVAAAISVGGWTGCRSKGSRSWPESDIGEEVAPAQAYAFGAAGPRACGVLEKSDRTAGSKR